MALNKYIGLAEIVNNLDVFRFDEVTMVVNKKYENPLVSVCIPVFNGAEFLEETINSILIQTYKHVEIISSDDSSVDKSMDILRFFEKKSLFPFKIYRNSNSGIGNNWNNCVLNANGKYIKFLFQDDCMSSDCIEKMVNHIALNESLGMVFCRAEIKYEKENEKHIEWVDKFQNIHYSFDEINGINHGLDLLSKRNLLRNPLNKIGSPSATLIRKEVFDDIGLFHANLNQTLDIEYWWRIMANYDIGFIDEELIVFRLHEKQATFVNARKKIAKNESSFLMKTLLKNEIYGKLNRTVKWIIFLEYKLRFYIVRKFYKRYIKRFVMSLLKNNKIVT